MIRSLLGLIILSSISIRAVSQDIPLFSQKLTNSFIYNPSFAGLGFGSFTYSYRNNYSGVEGAPVNNFLSLHTPFANHRFGVGLNFYQEDVSALKNTYISGAFAYHIRFDKYSHLSFGISGEYNAIQVNGADLNFEQIRQDFVLDRLREGKNNSMDFSFGASYANQYLKAGFALNRLSTAWLKKEDTTRVLTSYQSGFLQGTIRLRGDQDMLEPYVAYRKYSASNNTIDAGIYYTYNNKISAGAAIRRFTQSSTGAVNFTLGYHLSKNLMVGYSREMLTGGVNGFVGATNEFAIRLDFNNQVAKAKFRDDYKSSLSYRRKVLTTSAAKRTTQGARNPKQLHKAQKKIAAYSPNRRYQNTAKLSHGKKAPIKKSYNSAKKKRRPSSLSKASKFKRKKPTGQRRR